MLELVVFVTFLTAVIKYLPNQPGENEVGFTVEAQSVIAGRLGSRSSIHLRTSTARKQRETDAAAQPPSSFLCSSQDSVIHIG